MKPKVIGVALKDVPNISDVLCVCEPRGGGTVTVFANAQGRACLQKVFPTSQTSWTLGEPMPREWLQTVFKRA